MAPRSSTQQPAAATSVSPGKSTDGSTEARSPTSPLVSRAASGPSSAIQLGRAGPVLPPEVQMLILKALLLQGPQMWTWRTARQVSQTWRLMVEMYASAKWFQRAMLVTAPNPKEWAVCQQMDLGVPTLHFDRFKNDRTVSFSSDPQHTASTAAENAIIKASLAQRRFTIELDEGKSVHDGRALKSLSGFHTKSSRSGFVANIPWRGLLSDLFNAQAQKE